MELVLKPHKLRSYAESKSLEDLTIWDFNLGDEAIEKYDRIVYEDGELYKVLKSRGKRTYKYDHKYVPHGDMADQNEAIFYQALQELIKKTPIEELKRVFNYEEYDVRDIRTREILLKEPNDKETKFLHELHKKNLNMIRVSLKIK